MILMRHTRAFKMQSFVLVISIGINVWQFTRFASHEEFEARLVASESELMSRQNARSTPNGNSIPDHASSGADQESTGMPHLGPAEAEMVTLMQKASNLSTVDFGKRLAALMLATDSLESIREKAAMISTINGERMAACYIAYKKLASKTANQNVQELRPLLIAAGQQDGLKAVTAMQAIAPEFQEMGSLVHGLVLKDPAAAVDWFNAQNEHPPQHALAGLMWGIGQKDSALAKKVFDSLGPEDQASSAQGLASSLTITYGFQAVDNLMQGLSPELAQQVMAGAMNRISRRPPEESVPWLAAKAEKYPEMSAHLESAFNRWMAADPEAAQRWSAQEQYGAAMPPSKQNFPVTNPPSAGALRLDMHAVPQKDSGTP